MFNNLSLEWARELPDIMQRHQEPERLAAEAKVTMTWQEGCHRSHIQGMGHDWMHGMLMIEKRPRLTPE